MDGASLLNSSRSLSIHEGGGRDSCAGYDGYPQQPATGKFGYPVDLRPSDGGSLPNIVSARLAGTVGSFRETPLVSMVPGRQTRPSSVLDTDGRTEGALTGIAKLSPIVPRSMTAADSGQSSPLLYRHVGCPYCERVVRVAQHLDLDFRSRFVVPTHSQRDHVKRISGTRTVPMLVDSEAGITLSESANIVEYLRTRYGGGA